MGGNNDLVKCEQRGIGRGLCFKDIERCTSHFAAFDRIVKRLFVNDTTTGAVDNPHPVLHGRNTLCVDEVFCLGDQRACAR